MRIRKHARISSPPIATAQPDTHVCQLNRSPWDVISFNTSPKSNYKYQVKREDDNYTCHRVERGLESAYTPGSVSCVEERCLDKVLPKKVKEDMEDVYNEMEEEERRLFLSGLKKNRKKEVKVRREADYITCAKTDGKGWYCKNEAKEGEFLCEHHIIQLQSYRDKSNRSRKPTKVKPAAAAPVKREKVKIVVAANKRKNRGRVSSASPADFYYYSGFGPSWGKRRAGENEIKKEDMEVSHDANEQASASVVQVPHQNGHTDIANYDDHIEDEFDDDDEDQDEDEEHGGKKRIRRPIKARSLRSIL